MYFDKLNRPITSERIEQHETVCHYLIHRHFRSLVFPDSLDYDDVLQMCRLEVFKALQKFDPEKAMGSTIEDPILRAQKLEEKRANPEKAYETAERNVVYWQVDNELGRLRYKTGFKTGVQKRRGRHVSLEYLLTDKTASPSDVQLLPSNDVDYLNISQNNLSDDKRETSEALLKSVAWLFRYRGAKKAKQAFDRMKAEHQELLKEHLEHLVAGKRRYQDRVNFPIINQEEES